MLDRVAIKDIRICLSHGPPEPGTYVQVSPEHVDAQIVAIPLEKCSPPN